MQFRYGITEPFEAENREEAERIVIERMEAKEYHPGRTYCYLPFLLRSEEDPPLRFLETPEEIQEYLEGKN
jgi:hypothetical protein